MDATSQQTTPADQTEASRFTVLGLFDDTIDAEQTLVALRREDRPREQVSILVRDRSADAGSGPERHGEVARAVVANALSAVSGWLLGLASLIIPENGTYLVAGPIGAALTGVGTIDEHIRQRSQDEAGDDSADGANLPAGGLKRTLTDFGFRSDEAAYLQSGLAAGSALIAVTTSDSDQLQATRRLFADYSAVHIGQAQTGETIIQEVQELLAAAPEDSSSGDLVVADAVAPLIYLCAADSPDTPRPRLCGARVVDHLGEETGDLEELFADGMPGADPPTIRYVLVGFGGLLGILRHRIAVPAEQIDLQSDPVRLAFSKDVLRRAPTYNPDIPFSRREEMAINVYFGTTPYWLK